MHTSIQGAPSYAYLHIDLAPGESVAADRRAVLSRDLRLKLRGLRRVCTVTNAGDRPARLTLAHRLPGDIVAVPVRGGDFRLRPAALLAAAPSLTINFGARWARVRGEGVVWIAAFGGIVERVVSRGADGLVRGPYVVALDAGVERRRVGWDGIQLRVSGEGRYYLQTRGLEALQP